MQFLIKAIIRSGDYIRGLAIYLLINICGGQCKSIPRIGKNITLKYPPHKGLKIGKGCDFGPNTFIDCPPGGELTIGSNVKLTAGVIISCANKITIGNNSLIAEYSCLRDSQHKYRRGKLIREQSLSVGSIVIGEDVWVGRSCSILKNSFIGEGCIISAASLIKDSHLQEYSVFSGKPAAFIKKRI